MKKTLAAAILSAISLDVRTLPAADACGVKLTVKSSAPRKAVARTSNPSDVLLVGDPPRRLEADLTAAGHRVEVARTAGEAKRSNYAVVITDARHQEEARARFKESPVLVRSGDVTADMRSVEQRVARKPVRADDSRAVVAARPARAPIAAGPPREARPVVASKETTDAPPAQPPATPERIATVPTPPADPRPAAAATSAPAPAPESRPRPQPAAVAAALREEVYFGYNNVRVPSPDRTLARAVRWMTARGDAQIVIEGHADPAGTPDANRWLAQKRAESVRDYLVSVGIDASRIEVVSYGDTRLKYGSDDGRNRRAAILSK